MDRYFASCESLDWKHPLILEKAEEIAVGRCGAEETAKACFEYVRDEIKHSNDFQMNPVTCRASEVLAYRTGYCYAKSHLLAALLRANGIPAGLCYQRLTIADNRPPFCLHGLNAVYLPSTGWYRIDARGNKDGVDAQFTPPVERLAYPVLVKGEADLPEIWAQPLPEVRRVLLSCRTYQEVAENLPDIELMNP
ncbi:MAG: transglutaminase family protein [Gammaproteobacteria bacterium]